ncbi:MAG: DUF3237 domain-containing protein [Candidatus Binatia bacterium]
MIGYELEHVLSYRARLRRPQVIGRVAEGIRVFFPVDEGEVTGPRVYGRLLPGGGDWLTVRTDGVQILDVRGTLETDDGAILYAAYTGVGDLGEDGYEKFLRGERPSTIRLRASGRFLAGDPRYAWLNRVQCLNVGEADTARAEVRYDVYAVK